MSVQSSPQPSAASSSAPGLRILTVMNCLGAHRSGMPTANASLSREQRALGCTVDHLYLEDFPPPARRYGLNYVLFALASVPLIRRLERQRGAYDVIQISGGDAYVAPLLRRDLYSRRRLIVSRSHGLEHRYWQAFRREVGLGRQHLSVQHRLYFGALRLKEVEYSVRLSDLLNCHTQADAQYAIARGWKRPEEVAILPSAIEADWMEWEPTPRPKLSRILFSGSWTWMKGPHVVSAVFERLRRSHPTLELTLIGTGAAEDAVLRAFAPHLHPHLRIRAGLTHAEVRAEMQRHDLLLATSLFEGFGTIVTEAMAAGLPVVASEAGAAPDYIRHAENGYLFPTGDVGACVAACELVLAASPEELLARRIAAREAVRDITWQAVAAATLDVYAAALAALGSQVN